MNKQNQLKHLQNISGEVCVVGSINADYTVACDRIPHPGETVQGGPLNIFPGGKSANQAVSAALLGAHVTLLGAVGSDASANFLLKSLQTAGVCTQAIKHVEGSSGSALITVDAKGENTIVYSPGANASVTPEYIKSQAALITSASVLGLCLESPLETVIEAARIAHNAGLKVLLNNSPFMQTLPEDLIKYTDILLVNRHELADMLHMPEAAYEIGSAISWQKIAKAVQNLGFNQAIVTLGSAGSVAINGSEIHHINAQSVPCTDTTGCGDAFMGAVLASLASGFSLADACISASYVAAYAARGRGAQSSYGSSEEIITYFS